MGESARRRGGGRVKLLPVWAVVQRDLLRMVRHRARLLSTFVRPLIWFFVIGAGVGVLVNPQLPGSYQRFLIPGVLGMTILFGAMLVALAVVYDKESGVMRLLVTAPLPQYWIVLAKILGATLIATLQAGVVFLLLALLGFAGDAVSIPMLLVAIAMTSLACACLGMIVAVSTSTLDNFAAVMNFVIFPVFFLSGALYPVRALPPALALVVRANPFSYGVDLLKHAVLGEQVILGGADFPVFVDVSVLAGFAVAATLACSWRFSHEMRAGMQSFLRRD